MSQLCINDPEQAQAIYYSYSAEIPSKLMENMPTILAKQYQLQTIHVLAVDGTPLPISVIGNGTPVLMLHAFGMDTRQFLPFILPLTNHYRFYLPHFRGFGLATALTLPNFDFIEQYAEDTEQVLKYITIENNAATVSVAGISMGALVMWAYFRRFGSSVCTTKWGITSRRTRSDFTLHSHFVFSSCHSVLFYARHHRRVILKRRFSVNGYHHYYFGRFTTRRKTASHTSRTLASMDSSGCLRAIYWLSGSVSCHA